MNMRTLWIIVVIVIIAAGGWYLLTENSSTPITDTNQDGTGGTDQTLPPTNTDTGTDVGMEDGTGSPSTDTPNTQGYDALITYTNAGYNPLSLTIKKGQTVRFLNDSSSEQTWPASAIHPTHALYPQKSSSDCLGSSFDACRALNSSEHWDFTFSEVGTWRYHDHLHTNKTGTVVVTE